MRAAHPLAKAVVVLLMSALSPVLWAGEPVAAPVYGWRDMFRDYLKLKDTRADYTGAFPGFDTEMARLGEAFARTAYPADPALGRRNFQRLVLKLGLTHPNAGRRLAFFTPNKSPWCGYAGEVDESDGLAHFLFNTGTLPMPLFSHPIVDVVRSHDVARARVKPIAQCAARVIRLERADLRLVEQQAALRAALVTKIRAAFDRENPTARMSDEEARCLAGCLPYMA